MAGERRADTPASGDAVCLVLGAGGIAGAAFEAGGLAALEDVTGWTPARASTVIGTSAGSWIGSLLAAGYRPADLYRLNEEPTSRIASPLRHLTHSPASLYSPNFFPRFWDSRYYAIHHTPFTTRGMERFLSRTLPGRGKTWPGAELRIVAFDATARERVVLDRWSNVPLRRAIAASSCIPYLFRPVEVDGRELVDGGVWSTTNLDLSIELDVSLAICFAPMVIHPEHRSARPSRFRNMAGELADLALHGLHEEVEQIQARRPDLDVLILRPNEDEARAIGHNAMDPRRQEMVAWNAYRATLEKLRQPETRALLEEHGILR